MGAKNRIKAYTLRVALQCTYNTERDKDLELQEEKAMELVAIGIYITTRPNCATHSMPLDPQQDMLNLGYETFENHDSTRDAHCPSSGGRNGVN